MSPGAYRLAKTLKTMKILKTIAPLWFLALAILTCVNHAAAQGTAFTYQGRLDNGTNPANGSYDLTFALYNASSGGSQTGSTITNLAVGVTNGLFLVTNDFGVVYNGTAYWLQIGVRTNGGSSFSPLSPRQELTPTPYAIYAEISGSTGDFSAAGTSVYAGSAAGNSTSSGGFNVGVGYGAMLSITSGSYNTANGYYALESNQGGYANTADGANALDDNTSGSENTAVGGAALGGNTLGSNNVAVGYFAADGNRTDNAIVAIGYEALQNENALNNGNTSSGTGENTAVGYQALQTDTTGSGNTAVGYVALNQNSNGYNNTAVGDSALHSNASGVDNTAVGIFALSANTTASYNTAVGESAMGGPLFGITTGGYNTAIGALALAFDSTGTNNTGSGANALALNTTGNNDTADGAYALGGGGGVTTGGGDTGVGSYTLYDLTTGYNNVAAGVEALYADTTGFDNIGIGVATYQVNSTGYQNTAVGTYAFQNMTAGNGNVGLGYYAGNSLIAGSNNIYIGNSGASSDNNVIRIGSGQSETFIAGSKVGINNNNPTTALDVGGEFIAVEGSSGVRCYIGDDGSGNDVQLGSLKSGITAVSMYNEADSAYMHLYCSSITIEGGSDLAEPFQISAADRKITEGAVVVIDEENPGQLKMSDRPYDSHVAGVVSGANGINPGIQMQQQGLLEGGKNVALTGRVYVQADTSNGVIKPGDLLTTSSTPGRAMKVTNHAKAEGAILGKAMTGLKDGQGMVLVLVTLQ